MSEAIDYSVSNNFTELDHARRERLKSTLIFLTKEYRESRTRIEELSKEIKILVNDLKNLQFKRKRLMDQNFSAADHLKQTHTKYWSEFQDKTRIYQVKYGQLQYYKEKVDLLTIKIPEVKDTLFQMV